MKIQQSASPGQVSEEELDLQEREALISSLAGRHLLIFGDKIGIGIGIAFAVGIAIETVAGRLGRPIAIAIPIAIPIPGTFFRVHCLYAYDLISMC